MVDLCQADSLKKKKGNLFMRVERLKKWQPMEQFLAIIASF